MRKMMIISKFEEKMIWVGFERLEIMEDFVGGEEVVLRWIE